MPFNAHTYTLRKREKEREAVGQKERKNRKGKRVGCVLSLPAVQISGDEIERERERERKYSSGFSMNFGKFDTHTG